MTTPKPSLGWVLDHAWSRATRPSRSAAASSRSICSRVISSCRSAAGPVRFMGPQTPIFSIAAIRMTLASSSACVVFFVMMPSPPADDRNQWREHPHHRDKPKAPGQPAQARVRSEKLKHFAHLSVNVKIQSRSPHAASWGMNEKPPDVGAYRGFCFSVGTELGSALRLDLLEPLHRRIVLLLARCSSPRGTAFHPREFRP